MSDQETNEEDSGGIFCQNCTPGQRKWGYYITFLLGALVFVFGIIDVFRNDNKDGTVKNTSLENEFSPFFKLK